MIVTLTLNPSIDKYGEVKDVKYEDSMRLHDVVYDPGGKGINVSRVLKRFDIDAPALYFYGGAYGKIFNDLLAKEKVTAKPVEIDGETRINYTVYNRANGKVLKFNDPGPEASDADLEKIRALVESFVTPDTIFVFSGNILPGMKRTFYADLINGVAGRCKYVMFDTESDLLVENLAHCKPTFIKPNITETGRIIGRDLKKDGDFIEALEMLKDKVTHPIVSAAERGVFFKNPDDGHYYNVVPPDVKVVSTVGAGDSFIAGFVMSVSMGNSMLDSVKTGAACGTATVMSAGTDLCHPDDVAKIFRDVKAHVIG